MKKFESSEISSGNASGKAGTGSLPFNRGYYQSKNNNDFGVDFMPSSEPSFKNYKSLKHSKKNLKERMKKFKNFLKEDAVATVGNTSGMGAVSSAQPSSTPGYVNGSTIGSGDIGCSLGTYTKSPFTKKKKGKMKNILSFKNFNPKNESKQFEEYYTFECSGTPKPYFKTKAEFFEFMEENGFKHSTLNKKTDMLIVESLDMGSLKCQKAQKYEIPIYTYKQAKVKVKEMANDLSKFNL